MKRFVVLLIAFFLVHSSHLLAQAAPAVQATDGISQVLSIESKAGNYKELEDKLARLDSALTEIRKRKGKKIDQLQAELDSMKKKRDVEVGELKLGYRCSQCKVLKSEMEKKGENFEAHLKKVNGVPIPAGDDEIAAKRQEWSEKIAVKQVQLNNFKTQGDPAETAKKDEIAKTKEMKDKICPELVVLSKKYEEIVVAQGKRIQASWIDDAMGAAASQHIIEDRIFIANATMAALDKERMQKEQQLREKMKKDNDDNIAKLRTTALALGERIHDAETEGAQETKDTDDKLAPLKTELQSIERQIKPVMKDSLRKALTAQAAALRSSIAAIQKQHQAAQGSYTANIAKWKTEQKKANDDAWGLTTGISKAQDQAVLAMRKPYDDRIAQLKVSKADLEKQQAVARTRFLTLAEDARKKIGAFSAAIEKENSRMLNAVAPIKCSIWTQAHLTVNQNFNSEAGCMEGLRNRDRSFPAVSMDCASKSRGYMFIYKSFASSLSAEDAQVVKANTGTYWYEGVFGK